jgi:hypothetical protein
MISVQIADRTSAVNTLIILFLTKRKYRKKTGDNMTVDLDPTTQANYTQIASTHVHLDWSIDFEAKCVVGSATHTFVVKEGGVSVVVYVPSF